MTFKVLHVGAKTGSEGHAVIALWPEGAPLYSRGLHLLT